MLGRAFLAAGCAAFIGSACGSPSSQVGSQPSWRKPNEVQGFVTEPASRTLAPIVFAPETPAVAAYNDPPRRPAPSAPLADAIVAALEQAAEQKGLPAPAPDGRLYAATAELAAVVPDQGPLPYPLIEFAMQRHGIIEPSPHLLVMWGPLDDADAIMEQLTHRIPEILGSGRFGRVGIGTARRSPNGEGVAILALQASSIDTKPIPRQLPRGGLIRLQGRIHPPYQDPQVFVTREDGTVERPSITRTEGHSFLSELSCDGRRGVQQIEITGIDASGSTVLANFPVWCNESAPVSLTVHPTEDDHAPIVSAEQAERRMVELVNQDRTRAGLPPLTVDARVAEVARGHSREMATTGVVAHVSPTTGSAADRVRAGGIRTAVVLENVARAYGVAEAQAGLMNSPGHRANILSAQATHVGVGIVLGEEVAGRRELFVTQVFTRVPPPIQAGQVRQVVRDRIKGTGRALAAHPPLDELAQRYAQAIAAGADPQEASRALGPALQSLSSGFRRVTTVITTVADVEGFDAASAVGEAGMTHYGLGVAQGDHPTLGEGSIYIVILLAQQR